MQQIRKNGRHNPSTTSCHQPTSSMTFYSTLSNMSRHRSIVNKYGRRRTYALNGNTTGSDSSSDIRSPWRFFSEHIRAIDSSERLFDKPRIGRAPSSEFRRVVEELRLEEDDGRRSPTTQSRPTRGDVMIWSRRPPAEVEETFETSSTQLRHSNNDQDGADDRMSRRMRKQTSFAPRRSRRKEMTSCEIIPDSERGDAAGNETEIERISEEDRTRRELYGRYLDRKTFWWNGFVTEEGKMAVQELENNNKSKGSRGRAATLD